MNIDYDVELTGFDTGELDKLLNFSVVEGPDPDDLDEPDRGIPPVSRLGDTWLLGDHRLHCGDALNTGSYEAVLGTSEAQMVFTDPPYNTSGLGS